jgi:alpha-L-fucosidase
VYLHVFDWPADGRLRLPPFGQTVKKAYLLATPAKSLKFDNAADGVVLHLPPQAADPIATVVVLETP